MDLYIKVKSSNYNAGDSEKLSKISEQTLKDIKPFVHELLKTKDTWNWTWRTELERTDTGCGWGEVKKIYSMYPNINKKTITKFLSFVPSNAERIDSVEVLRLEKVNYEF